MKERGQTLLEILVALGTGVVVLLALSTTVLTSLNSTQYSKNQNLATLYAQQGLEIVRGIKQTDWNSFYTNYTPAGGVVGSSSSFCLPKDDTTPNPGSCGVAVIDGVYKRDIKFEILEVGTRVKTTETVSFTDSKGEHKSELVTVFTDWQEGLGIGSGPSPTPGGPTSTPTPTPPAPTPTPTPTPIPIIPIYRFWSFGDSDHFYSRFSTTPTNYVLEGVGFNAYAPPCPTGTIPIYRSYHGGIKDHLYSTSSTEGPNAGYTNEGTEFCAFSSSVSGSIPVYRLWNLSASDHFYTTSASEANNASGYTIEDRKYFYVPQ